MKQIDALTRKLNREQKARKEAEALLEKKSLELYKLNESLKFTNRNLEDLVNERTKDLEKAMDQANLANQAKSQFLANMSHEIRTPLNGILGFLEILRGTKLEEHQITYLNFIDNSSKLLLSIVNDVLEFSKIEEGKMEVNLESFNLEDCLFEVVSGLSNEIYKKKLESLVLIDERFKENIVSDQSRIRQLIVNLIGNSIKFTPTGYVSLKAFPISTEKGELMVLRVIDTGVGIPKDKLYKVFEDFAQVDVSDTRKYGGSGLGLSICKKIAEALGGKIKLRSLEGVGTIFDVILPLSFDESYDKPIPTEITKSKAFLYIPEKKLAQNFSRRFKTWGVQPTLDDKSGLFFKFPKPADENEIFLIDSKLVFEEEMIDLVRKSVGHDIVLLAAPSEVGELREVFGDKVQILHKPIHREEIRKILVRKVEKEVKSKKQVESKPAVEESVKCRILVAEDNFVNQQLMEALLLDFGFDYKIVENGREAVEAVEKEEFGLILMDCQMPEMDGFDATLKIRELGYEMPILAMTANAFRSTKEKCFQVGMNSFITKPLKPMDLLKEIEEFRKQPSSE